MQAIYEAWPEAQWVDEVRGIGMVTAVSVLAHIGPIERFPTAEDLISYAGLAPGTWRSDATCRHGRIGGGGTDKHLRYLLIEASMWLCQSPRYRPAYERVEAKRGTYEALLSRHGLTPADAACMGDDLLDLPLFAGTGLALSVPSGAAELRAAAHYITRRPAGSGAVREAIELILKAQRRWDALLTA